MKIFIILIGCIFIYGCAEEIVPPPPAEKTALPPATEKTTEPEPGVTDYFTGRQHMRIYKKMKSKLEEINKSRQEQQEQYNDF